MSACVLRRRKRKQASEWILPYLLRAQKRFLEPLPRRPILQNFLPERGWNLWDCMWARMRNSPWKLPCRIRPCWFYQEIRILDRAASARRLLHTEPHNAQVLWKQPCTAFLQRESHPLRRTEYPQGNLHSLYSQSSHPQPEPGPTPLLYQRSKTRESDSLPAQCGPGILTQALSQIPLFLRVVRGFS